MTNDKDNMIDRNRSVEVTIAPCQEKNLSTLLLKKPPVDIVFSDLSYTVSVGKRANPKNVLKSISGCMQSGKLTAVMGLSGAGKSTLLNVLTGYKTAGVEGSITINNCERNLEQFKKLSCYIMQDNQLHGNLTVEETMKVAASLKISSNSCKCHKEKVVEEILETLGLQVHRKVLASNLSGGQKKRLSIALELVNNPPVMFFDEPTSGLDSLSSFQCISLLKSLSQGGRTIICTIHQPSASTFDLFDQLYALVKGQCVYQGSIQQLVPFLYSLGLVCPDYHNPASFLFEVCCTQDGKNVEKLVDAIENGKQNIQINGPLPKKQLQKLNNATLDFDNGNTHVKVENVSTTLEGKSKDAGINDITNHLIDQTEKTPGLKDRYENYLVDIELTGETSRETNKEKNPTELFLSVENELKKSYPVSELRQMWIIFKRALLFTRRDSTLMYLRLFAYVAVGLLVGVIYYDIGNDAAKVLSNLGFLFFNMIFLMYSSMIISVLSFPLELPVLIKEHFNRWYSLRAYYLAVTISDFPFQVIFGVMYVSIIYYMTGQPREWFRFGMFLSACLLLSLVSQSVGLLAGAALDAQSGVFVAPVTSLPLMVFSGFFVSYDSIPVYLRWMTYISYARYGFEGTALATYGYNRTKLNCSQKSCRFSDPKAVLDSLDMGNSKFELDIVAPVITFLILKIATILFLKWKLTSVR